MPTLISWIKRHRKELGIAGGAFLGTVLLFVLVFYTPKPALIDPPTSTKEAIVTLKGKVAPHRGVVVFNQTGDALVVVNSDDKGEFTLNNIPIGEGKNVLTLRSVASRYRLSLPLFIVIQKDTTAPALSMNTLQGATVTGSNTIVSGKAEPGSTVMVNGVKTTVGADVARRFNIGWPSPAERRRAREIVHHRDRHDARAKRLIGGDLTDVHLITAATVPGGMNNGDGFAGERPRLLRASGLRPPRRG